jgi:hypothetical protein
MRRQDARGKPILKVGDLVRGVMHEKYENHGVGLVVSIKHMTKVKIAKVEWSNGSAGYYGLHILKRVS